MENTSITSVTPATSGGVIKPRLSLVEMLYHARPGQSPTAVETRIYRWLATNEQPYIRQLLIGGCWTFLEYGWVKEPGVLHVKNEEGFKYQTFPTEQQRLEVESRILLLGVVTEDRVEPFTMVHPGFSQRVDVPEDKRYALRCVTGTAQTTVTVLSR